MDDNFFKKLIALPFRFVFWLLSLAHKLAKIVFGKAFNTITTWVGNFIAVAVLVFFLGIISQNFIK